MKVCITGKEFEVVVKEEGKEDITLNANIEVFNNPTMFQRFILNALDELNEESDLYFNNVVAILGEYHYVPNVKYNYCGHEVNVENNLSLKVASLENPPSEEELKKMIRQLKGVVTISPFSIYEVKNLEDVYLACILHYSQYGFTPKRCKNCGDWFISKTTKETKYCYRNDAEYPTMQCDLAFKYKERLKRVENDDAYILHKKVYNSLRNKLLRASESSKKQAQKLFDDFKIENSNKLELLKEKKISQDDYITWLSSKRENANKKD